MEILGRLFLAAFEFGRAERGFDKINEITAGAAIRPAEVVFVEVMAGLVEAVRELCFLLGRERLAGFNLFQ